MSAQPAAPAWAPLARDLSSILSKRTANPRATLYRAAVELTRDDVTGRVNAAAVTAHEIIWAAVEIVGLDASPDERLRALCRSLAIYLADLTQRPAEEIHARLRAVASDLSPTPTAAALADAYLRLRRDLATASEALADIASAEERAVAGRAYSANGKCRSCGAPVHWHLSGVNGKNTPHDLDGTSHFKTCPQANDWSKRSR